MDNVYVLTTLRIESGNVICKNVGLTFNLHAAEFHKEQGVEHDFETFQIDGNWQEAAARTEFVLAMRGLRDIVTNMQEQALR
jgi:hypothetical protein